MSAVCCQAQVSANGRSVDQRSPAEWGVFGYTREISTLRRPETTRAGKPGGGRGKGQTYFVDYSFICLTYFNEECCVGRSEKFKNSYLSPQFIDIFNHAFCDN